MCKDILDNVANLGNVVNVENVGNVVNVVNVDNENTSANEAILRNVVRVEQILPIQTPPYDPFSYLRRQSAEVSNIGAKHVPVVVADLHNATTISPADLTAIGYQYNAATDKWNIGDAAADFIYTGKVIVNFALPGTLKVMVDHDSWLSVDDRDKYFPLINLSGLAEMPLLSSMINFVLFDVSDNDSWQNMLDQLKQNHTMVACLHCSHGPSMLALRRFIMEMMVQQVCNPMIIKVETNRDSVDEQLVHFSAEAGALFLEGMGDGLWIWNHRNNLENVMVSGRTYLEVKNNFQFLNNTAFSILQATRTRISKTEYISCPSCGRTLFDLQETTARIRSHTYHLKGVKIAIMGCIVNGPGEMADADFGYVGSGPGKITLYRGKEVVKKNVDSEIALSELINLLQESGVWIERGK